MVSEQRKQQYVIKSFCVTWKSMPRGLKYEDTSCPTAPWKVRYWVEQYQWVLPVFTTSTITNPLPKFKKIRKTNKT